MCVLIWPSYFIRSSSIFNGRGAMDKALSVWPADMLGRNLFIDCFWMAGVSAAMGLLTKLFINNSVSFILKFSLESHLLNFRLFFSFVEFTLYLFLVLSKFYPIKDPGICGDPIDLFRLLPLDNRAPLLRLTFLKCSVVSRLFIFINISIEVLMYSIKVISFSGCWELFGSRFSDFLWNSFPASFSAVRAL